MTTAGKIRLLLALLFASLLFTAIVVEKTHTPEDNLAQTARILEDNLHAKEKLIYEVINNQQKFNELRLLSSDPTKAIGYIQEFTTSNRIWLLTYAKTRLNFWSGIKAIPDITRIKEGCSFLKLANGYYELIKKTQGDFSALFLIPVKNNFLLENRYLENTFATGISDDKNITMADFTDKNVYAIHDINKTYLFAVKLIPGKINVHFYYYELLLWILSVITLCTLIHLIITYLANDKKQLYLALLLLALFIVLSRVINLYLGWPQITRQLPLFNPAYYASGAIYASLGDLCINILAIFWFVSFLYTQRNKLLIHIPGKAGGYFLFFSGLIILILTSAGLFDVFYGLIINSNVNFNVNNILNLSGFSFIGVLMLCFSFLLFFLLTEVVLTLFSRLQIAATRQAVMIIATVLLTTAVVYVYRGFTLFYILWGAIVIIRGYAYAFNDKILGSRSFIVIILLCAMIASVNLNYFESVKEQETAKSLIQKLGVADDITADDLFKKIEKTIIADPFIVSYLTATDRDDEYLKIRFKKLYFDRYLSKYDLKIHGFNLLGQPVSGDKGYSLDIFKDLVVYSSFKVSDHFYRENDSFGYQSYFAILPVSKGKSPAGTLVIELRSKLLHDEGSFPELLMDNKITPEDEYKDYSYAFYTDDTLIGQSGLYTYSIKNTTFKGGVKKYIAKTTSAPDSTGFNRLTTYKHLSYKPGKRNLIVVSKEANILLANLTALTFFFIFMLLFSGLVILIRQLWLRIKIINISNNSFKWNFNINFGRMLYKTRIQFSMIFAVVATLLLVGIITFTSISTQYQTQQDKLIRAKIMQLSTALEHGQASDYIDHITDKSRVNFDKLAATYATDVTIFNLNGVPVITTQPKIYDDGLLARRMNGRAFVALNTQQLSEFLNEEKIGNLTYKAAYVPLRDDQHKMVGFLQLPYFANVSDYTERIGSLLNIMINVYALVLIAIGLFAVIIARQITAPLNFIQYNLSKTIYGKKNEPINWDRDDEIGALVKEYNKMIAALENSALRLAQSERESAWREMAKQVAHEIKNPLTPLKLGLQLLDKSWRDKDPKFDQKFERFSKSFVEQIESLSSIASEFSAFAKMPDTRIEKINVFEMLSQAVTIFKHMENVSISFVAPITPFYITADRDQLLRCFNNLLKNAIEATPADKQCIIDINALITSKNILLTIKDNGNGIPENMREKIFEPNFTTKSSGTGLGLAFVKNSIENASGKVWFETAAGIGTTFYLNFPAADII